MIQISDKIINLLIKQNLFIKEQISLAKKPGQQMLDQIMTGIICLIKRKIS
jgi:hypothetical protein